MTPVPQPADVQSNGADAAPAEPADKAKAAVTATHAAVIREPVTKEKNRNIGGGVEIGIE